VAANSGYAGDVDVGETWAQLCSDARAVLVDVRTVPEWNFVGIPDLAGIGKSVVLIEWQAYPSMAVNDKFVADLDEALLAQGVEKDAPVFFLCRSGGRSKAAAMAATADGYSSAFNVLDGFEGPLGDERHRGGTGGWKAEGLPWIQS
jgi:rhodanese-related sulfurtransferase